MKCIRHIVLVSILGCSALLTGCNKREATIIASAGIVHSVIAGPTKFRAKDIVLVLPENDKPMLVTFTDAVTGNRFTIEDFGYLSLNNINKTTFKIMKLK